MTTTGTVTLGVRAAFDGERLVPGDVALADGVVCALGLPPGEAAYVAVPGFVDLQVNGFAGVDLMAADAAALTALEAALARHGVTAYRPTLVSAAPDGVAAAVGRLSTAPSDITRLPVHLEGPFLSPSWPGAHRPDLLRLPDADLLDRLLAAGDVAHVTLAPELPGALDLVRRLRDAGATIAVGHSDATAAQAHAAFDTGATSLTHAFNAHRQLLAREPGPAAAAMARDDVWVHVIADGAHLAADTLRLVHRAAGDRMVAVTDAMPAAGLPDGDYRFADQTVTVAAGRATTAGGRLAGSVAGLDACLRHLVAVGVPLESALAAVTSAPAAAAGRPDLGRLRAGASADVVVLDEALQPVLTVARGATAYDARARQRGTGDG